MRGTPETDLVARADARLARDDDDGGDAREPAALRAMRFFVAGGDAARPSALVATHERDGGIGDVLLARAVALEALWTLDARLAGAARSLAAGGAAAAPSLASFAEAVAALLEGRHHDASLSEEDRSGPTEPLARARPQLDAIRALGALERGEHESALRLARRASLRAQVDLRFVDAAVCHLALARMRRAEGRPHLGLRIALSVLRGAGAAQRAWAGYEAALAAGAEPWPADATSSSFGTAARALILAASRGDRAETSSARDRLRREVSGAAWLTDEVAALIALLEGDAGDVRAGAFLRLEVDAAPYGLHWLAPAGGGRDETLAWIRIAPGSAPVRVLAVTAASSGTPALAVDGRGDRSTATVAALARARGPLASAALFRAVYGFAFDPALHGNLMRVALHRARAWLAPVGRIERAGDDVLLVPASEALVPDPSIRARLADRVLSRMGGAGGARASDVAEALGVPLRSVQREIETLVEEGALRVERTGGNLGYRVVDTIYSRSGLSPRDDGG